MDKTEYLRELRESLKGIPEDEKSELLSDYEEHIRMGLEEGRSEEELIQALGNPKELAKEIRAAYLVKKAEETTSADNLFRALMATIGLGLFNIFIVLVPFLVLAAILVALFLAGVAFTVAGPASILLGPSSSAGIALISALFFATGFSALGLLIIIGDYYVAQWLYEASIRYLKWNISIIRGNA
jgi:uncharacterized membrane protein